MDRKNDRVKKIHYELCTVYLNKNVSQARYLSNYLYVINGYHELLVTYNF